jgi:Zn ribbon nucleic-acid-binding protein
MSKTFCICTQKVHVSNLSRVACYFELVVTGECTDGKLTFTLIENVSILRVICSLYAAQSRMQLQCLKCGKLKKLHLYGRLENVERAPCTRCGLNTRREQDGEQRYERSDRHDEG